MSNVYIYNQNSNTISVSYTPIFYSINNKSLTNHLSSIDKKFNSVLPPIFLDLNDTFTVMSNNQCLYTYEFLNAGTLKINGMLINLN